VASLVEGLAPLGPDMLIEMDLDTLRQKSVAELIQLAYQVGVNVQQLAQERGALLTEIMRHSYDG
jgi:hypothetical protein